jgi:hypothetical protein
MTVPIVWGHDTASDRDDEPLRNRAVKKAPTLASTAIGSAVARMLVSNPPMNPSRPF